MSRIYVDATEFSAVDSLVVDRQICGIPQSGLNREMSHDYLPGCNRCTDPASREIQASMYAIPKL
jgi:hypothetical protein